MTKKLADISVNRLKNVLVGDKEQPSCNTIKMMQIDLSRILKSYFEIEDGTLFINCNICEDGKYLLNINAKAVRIRKAGVNLKSPRRYIF